MRILSLAVVLAGCIGASYSPSPELRPVVILVHGRGHLGQDTAALRREWKRDLDSSLTLVGMPRLADADVRLAWYADVLDPDSEGSGRGPRVSGVSRERGSGRRLARDTRTDG
jgi:hypothetical protein